MRLGILGGTFDPPHNAHAALARAAIASLHLDGLLIIPSGEPPHKRCLASAGDRLSLARAAFRDVPGACVSDIEAIRPGETYAVDTVRDLRRLYPDARLTYILGADALGKLPLWYGHDELVRLCDFACAARAGGEVGGAEAERIEASLPDISSSGIRERVRMGESIGEFVPAAVALEIAEKGLYLTDRTEEELIADLSARLSPPRMRHTLGVRDAAVELAQRCGLPSGKARIAGLLHDCAKNLSDDEMRTLADRAGADDMEGRNPQVLHAPAGETVARERYAVRDPAILSAIRRHTIGGRGMSLLDVIVYVADFIEPHRRTFPGLARARALAREDVWKAAAECARQTCAYAEGRGHTIHPATREMISEIEDGGTNNG